MVQSEILKREMVSFRPAHLQVRRFVSCKSSKMSVKRGRGAKLLKGPQNEHQRQKALLDSVDSPNLSAIEKISFLEGLQLNDSNPLHSTAVEQDLNMSEQGQENKGSTGGNDHRQLSKTAAQQRGAPVKRKEMDREEEEEEKKKKRKGMGGEFKARPKKKRQTKSQAPQRKRGETGVEREKSEPCTMVQGVQQSNPTSSNQIRHSARKNSVRTNFEQMSAARSVKNQPKKQTGSRKSSEPQSQEESDMSANQQGSDDILLSDEENPSPHKAKMSGLGRSDKFASRKSSSGKKILQGSLSAKGKQVVSDEQTKRRRKGQRGTELEVVLDAFLDFCGQYRESVESKAIKQSIDCFSSNVKEQLQEKISSFKELRFLKRENNKVRSLISAKTQRLLDAKYELMRAERQAWLLQKERDKLELRLSDLRRSQAFLRDIRELNSQYLDYRRKHPKECETYGASSLPALLLEAKHIHSAELQLRGINDQLEKRLNETRK